MAKNKISDLRNHLFETLERLTDPTDPMEIDRAKAVAQVASVIIDTAKVQVALLQVVRGTHPGTDFFEQPVDVDAPKAIDRVGDVPKLSHVVRKPRVPPQIEGVKDEEK